MRLKVAGPAADFARGVGDIVNLQMGPDGSLWYATATTVARIVYTAGNNMPPIISRVSDKIAFSFGGHVSK